jgi:predicted dehydrogenase
MAKAHTLAYNNVTQLYWPTLPEVVKVRIADISYELAQRGVTRWGWREATDDWQRITQSDDVDLVDIVTPNDTHAEIAIDAARNGKHLFCEKPLAPDVASAQAMLSAVEAAGVNHHVNFTYRGWPAVRLAKQLIEEGRIGRPMHFRGWFLQDYALDATLPRVWRMQRSRAGAGSIGDVGSHVIDLARHLVGEVERVLARSHTFIRQRPAAVDTGEAQFRAAKGAAGAGLEDVDVDDATDLLMEFTSGAIGTIQTNWTASGHKIDLGFEVGGDRGAVRMNWQHANELEFYSADDPSESVGFRSIVIGPEHPAAGAFWSVAGQQLGYHDAVLIAVHEVLESVASGKRAGPNFLDGLRACEIVDAALRSSQTGGWENVPHFQPATSRKSG